MTIKLSFAYLPLISSVGQSPKPQGISVVPTINPKMNPNNNDMNIPTIKDTNPTFWKIIFKIDILLLYLNN